MKDKIMGIWNNVKEWTDDHQEGLVTTGLYLGIIVLGYAVTIPYLLILDKLGFDVKGKK